MPNTSAIDTSGTGRSSSTIMSRFSAVNTSSRRSVVIRTITAEGTVKDATVGSLTIIPEEGQPRAGDGRYGFGPAAIEAARQMVFRPAEYNGQPFEVQINYTYRFSLPPKAVEAEEARGDARALTEALDAVERQVREGRKQPRNR